MVVESTGIVEEMVGQLEVMGMVMDENRWLNRKEEAPRKFPPHLNN